MIRNPDLELDSLVSEFLICDLGSVPKPLQASVSSILSRLIFGLGMSCCCLLFASRSQLLRPVVPKCQTMEWCL